MAIKLFSLRMLSILGEISFLFFVGLKPVTSQWDNCHLCYVQYKMCSATITSTLTTQKCHESSSVFLEDLQDFQTTQHHCSANECLVGWIPHTPAPSHSSGRNGGDTQNGAATENSNPTLSSFPSPSKCRATPPPTIDEKQGNEPFVMLWEDVQKAGESSALLKMPPRISST